MDLLIGLLHHLEIQLEGGLPVQANQVTLTAQMAVRVSRGGVGVGEQVAQQGNGVAQGRARSVGLTVGPQQSSQIAAGMHAAFNCQVEQQSLRLAQGKREAAFVMKHFWRSEYCQM